ncbi:hypothetical protein [Argonema antarcticum]|uniref:hypothetical protein n=1 Tax=Argonema antarcticum TaxID=2942763 RepID=UPI0020111958|nr:hypothetical protein [Argonema antarcticum]MCL1471332.1 hypothetical protein [Argonema antarcticum A004/B2]
MRDGQRFPFIQKFDEFGVSYWVPYLPLMLTYQGRSLEVLALLDTGSTVNVLPYEIGLELGVVWEEQTLSIPLAGNLARLEARGLLISSTIGRFPPVNFAFAWTRANDVPVILGYLNFFSEFDVCFYGSQLAFEVCPKQSRSN